MADIVTDLGINLMEEEIDEVIFQTNQFLTDATFTGSQGPFWWILQMCMALAALFSIIVAAGLAYKMMIKHEPLDILKLFRPLAVSIVLCWWYPPADTGIGNNGSSWCVLDFLAYIPNAIGSYTHDLYQAEASQIGDRFEEVQGLLHVRDTMYQNLQAQADVARTGTSPPTRHWWKRRWRTRGLTRSLPWRRRPRSSGSRLSPPEPSWALTRSSC